MKRPSHFIVVAWMTTACMLSFAGCDRTPPPQQQPQADWQQKYQNIQRKHAETEKQLARASSRITELQKDIRELNNKLSSEKSTRGNLKQQIKTLESRVKEWRTKHAKLAQKADQQGDNTSNTPAEQDNVSSDTIKVLSDKLTQATGVMIASGQYEQAIEILDSITQIHPDDPAILYKLAYCQRQTGHLDRAKRNYRRAIEETTKKDHSQNTMLARLYNNYGVVLMQQGDFEKALQAYKNAISSDETYATVYYNLGKLHMQYLDSPQKAIDAFRRHIAAGGSRPMSARNTIRKIQENMN